MKHADVFPSHLIEEWVKTKRRDIDDMRLVPHPWEVARYYDIKVEAEIKAKVEVEDKIIIFYLTSSLTLT